MLSGHLTILSQTIGTFSLGVSTNAEQTPGNNNINSQMRVLGYVQGYPSISHDSAINSSCKSQDSI